MISIKHKIQPLILVIIILLNACSFNTYTINPENKPKNEYVVVLHGILISNWQMDSLANYLANNGYEIINIAYPSTDYKLEELTKIIQSDIKKHLTKNQTVNFVGFSMGGLLLRTTLKDYKPNKLGRVVQIATPNKGSEVADLLQDTWFYQAIFGPAGQQLITNQSSFNQLFGPINYELGIIAGQNSFNFIFQGAFDTSNDGLVATDKAILKEAKDYIILNGTHSLMPLNSEVQKQVLTFIETGRFKK